MVCCAKEILCKGEGEGGGEEYDNFSNICTYHGVLLATMGDYLRNDILL